MLEVIQIVKTL